ncbi:hypothetical protein D3C83_221770 [compost metagenome]
MEALDDEAIRAFEVAMPFPNPPQALFDGDDNVTFDFGFHFEIGHESFTSWKLYRGD